MMILQMQKKKKKKKDTPAIPEPATVAVAVAVTLEPTKSSKKKRKAEIEVVVEAAVDSAVEALQGTSTEKKAFNLQVYISFFVRYSKISCTWCIDWARFTFNTWFNLHPS